MGPLAPPSFGDSVHSSTSKLAADEYRTDSLPAHRGAKFIDKVALIECNCKRVEGVAYAIGADGWSDAFDLRPPPPA